MSGRDNSEWLQKSKTTATWNPQRFGHQGFSEEKDQDKGGRPEHRSLPLYSTRQNSIEKNFREMSVRDNSPLMQCHRTTSSSISSTFNSLAVHSPTEHADMSGGYNFRARSQSSSTDQSKWSQQRSTEKEHTDMHGEYISRLRSQSSSTGVTDWSHQDSTEQKQEAKRYGQESSNNSGNLHRAALDANDEDSDQDDKKEEAMRYGQESLCNSGSLQQAVSNAHDEDSDQDNKQNKDLGKKQLHNAKLIQIYDPNFILLLQRLDLRYPFERDDSAKENEIGFRGCKPESAERFHIALKKAEREIDPDVVEFLLKENRTKGYIVESKEVEDDFRLKVVCKDVTKDISCSLQKYAKQQQAYAQQQQVNVQQSKIQQTIDQSHISKIQQPRDQSPVHFFKQNIKLDDKKRCYAENFLMSFMKNNQCEIRNDSLEICGDNETAVRSIYNDIQIHLQHVDEKFVKSSSDEAHNIEVIQKYMKQYYDCYVALVTQTQSVPKKIDKIEDYVPIIRHFTYKGGLHIYILNEDIARFIFKSRIYIFQDEKAHSARVDYDTQLGKCLIHLAKGTETSKYELSSILSFCINKTNDEFAFHIGDVNYPLSTIASAFIERCKAKTGSTKVYIFEKEKNAVCEAFKFFCKKHKFVEVNERKNILTMALKETNHTKEPHKHSKIKIFLNNLEDENDYNIKKLTCYPVTVNENFEPRIEGQFQRNNKSWLEQEFKNLFDNDPDVLDIGLKLLIPQRHYSSAYLLYYVPEWGFGAFEVIKCCLKLCLQAALDEDYEAVIIVPPGISFNEYSYPEKYLAKKVFDVLDKELIHVQHGSSFLRQIHLKIHFDSYAKEFKKELEKRNPQSKSISGYIKEGLKYLTGSDKTSDQDTDTPLLRIVGLKSKIPIAVNYMETCGICKIEQKITQAPQRPDKNSSSVDPAQQSTDSENSVKFPSNMHKDDILTLSIRKSFTSKSWGLLLDEKKKTVYIKTLVPGYAAVSSGLREGDVVLEINRRNVQNNSKKDINKIIENSGVEFVIKVFRSASNESADAKAGCTKTDILKVIFDTSAQFERYHWKGMRLIERNGHIVIEDLYPGGIAEKGGIQDGDILLEINGISCKNYDYDADRVLKHVDNHILHSIYVSRSRKLKPTNQHQAQKHTTGQPTHSSETKGGRGGGQYQYQQHSNEQRRQRKK